MPLVGRDEIIESLVAAPHSLRKLLGTEGISAGLDVTKVADQLGNTARVLRVLCATPSATRRCDRADRGQDRPRTGRGRASTFGLGGPHNPARSGVASAQTDVGTGSANLAEGLGELLVTGSGGGQPLPKPTADGYTNPYLDGRSAGSSNLLTGLGNLTGTGSAAT